MRYWQLFKHCCALDPTQREGNFEKIMKNSMFHPSNACFLTDNLGSLPQLSQDSEDGDNLLESPLDLAAISGMQVLAGRIVQEETVQPVQSSQATAEGSGLAPPSGLRSASTVFSDTAFE
jgi:hypothetical protein